MRKLKVYLDNCCFNRPYDDQSQIKVSLEAQAKLHIQKMIVKGELDFVVSYMSVYENLQNPYAVRRDAITKFFKHASFFVDENSADKIQTCAARIMETGIKPKDAIHLACAVFARSDIFFSTDIRLLKYKTNEIALMNPVDFFGRMEEFI